VDAIGVVVDNDGVRWWCCVVSLKSGLRAGGLTGGACR
jgi:hypothetical protein